MNNQEELNSVPLNEAAIIISNALIKEKFELEKKRNELLEYMNIYEEAYIAANDGDASENAPLEAAISNLKRMTGELGNNAKVLQELNTIEDVNYLLGTYDVEQIIIAANDANPMCVNAFLSTVGFASVEDFRTSLRYIDVNLLSAGILQVNEYTKNNPDDKQSLLFRNALLDFFSVAIKPPYNTCGIIVPYTTVRLSLQGQIMTYRIYPPDISFIDIGVMAGNARVAKAILGKRVGDIVNVRHDSLGTLLHYEIKEIY